MAENTAVFENQSEYLYRTRKRVPTISCPPFYGLPAQAHSGDYCIRIAAIGTLFINDLLAGTFKISLKSCLNSIRRSTLSAIRSDLFYRAANDLIIGRRII
jgi:hypothetical protein